MIKLFGIPEYLEKIENCSPRPIDINKKLIISELEITPQPYSIFDGRMDVTDKVELYQKAKYEIMIFLEYIPFTLSKWLSKKPEKTTTQA